MKKTIFILLLITISSSIKAQLDSLLLNELQSVLDNSVWYGNNGVSACLLMPSGEIWTGTAGIGKDNIPISDTTVFHAASITKLNIATLMLLLVEENLINLDESWKSYIDLDVGFDTLITIRQLLNHTSGIADFLETPSSGNNITADFNYFFTPQYILENIVSDIPDFQAGTNFNYSNSNYVLAALIIEKVTGNPVHLELRTRLWEPLEMTHTYFGAYETFTEPAAGVWWNFGSGLQDYSNHPATSMLSFAYGAGNLISCPSDLAKLINNLLSGQILNPQSLDELLTFVPQSFGTWTAGYGLGIHHAYGINGDKVLGHDGYYTNLTDMFHSNNYGFTLVTMTNTQTTWFGIFNPMYAILKDYINDVLEIDNKNELLLYPNPANFQFELKWSQIIEELMITDVTGKIHFHSYPQTKSVSIDLDNEGLYFVIVKSDEQTEIRKLMVKFR